MPPRQPVWSWWDAIIVLGMLLALIPAAGLFKPYIARAVSALRVLDASPQALALFVSSVIQSSVMITAVGFLAWRKGAGLRDLGLAGNNFRSNLLSGLGGGFILAVLVWIAGIVVSVIIGPPPPQEIEKLLTGMKTGKDLLLPFISVSILAPLSEEFYFRGMVYPVIRARFGPVPGMILSGLFFGALHLDLYRMLPIGVMGYALAYFYERTGSLVTPIVAHSAWNTLMLLVLFGAGKYVNLG